MEEIGKASSINLITSKAWDLQQFGSHQFAPLNSFQLICRLSKMSLLALPMVLPVQERHIMDTGRKIFTLSTRTSATVVI